jgi:hypothetical protein
VEKEKTTEEVTEETKVKKVLLGEMPNLLALGTNPGGGAPLEKGVEMLRWNLKKEKELGALVGENKGVSVSFYTSMILSRMCTRIGHHDFTKNDVKADAKAMLVNQMYIGDVYAAWLHLRISALGNILHLEIPCPACKHDNKLPADLNTVEVVTADSVEDLYWEYQLKDPITIRRNTVTGFKFGPPRWSVMDQIDSPDNIGEAKAKVIMGSIVKVIGIEGDIALADHELDELSKTDFENIAAGINDHPLGPDMSVELKCKKCRREIVQPIDWTYSNFFSISSR